MRRDALTRLRSRAAAGALLALTAAACDGPNQFSTPLPTGGGSDVQAPVVDITVPRSESITSKPLGEPIEVHAFVDDDLGVDSVRFLGIERRGDPAFGTDTVLVRYVGKTVVLDQARDTVISRFLEAAPDQVQDTALIFVQAWDGMGNSSADSVRVVMGGPDVQLTNLQDGQAVQAGLTLSLQLRAYDPAGITRVQFDLEGVVEQSLIHLVEPPRDSVAFDTIVAIPPGGQGGLAVTARARNVAGIQGVDGPLQLTVGSGGAADTVAPTTLVTAAAEDLLELDDSVLVVVTGTDDQQGGGISRLGYTVVASSASRGDTITSDSVSFSSPRTGTISRSFLVPMVRVDSLNLPDTVDYQIHAFTVDAAGNCSAAVDDSGARIPCGTQDGHRVAQGRGGLGLEFAVVAGRTLELPSGGRIMDAVVDTARRNLMLSNIDRDRIEMFRMEEERFLPPVPVGSEPWGLGLSRPDGSGSDTLLVANSGGTNITKIHLGPADGEGPFVEDPAHRLLTPDVVLFNVEEQEDEFGFLRYNPVVLPGASPPAFSDRPQFLAADAFGRILYSTKATVLGDLGTIRKAFLPDGAEAPEVQLFFEHAIPDGTPPTTTALANVDGVAVVPGDFGDAVIVRDHVAGFPGQTITGGPALIGAAVAELGGNGSDVRAFSGAWDVPALGFTDTTFVSASGDGQWVVFGEGARDPVGRVIMYDAANDAMSGFVSVSDLMTNPSETVRGVGLNYDGTLGVARGFQAYFFTTDLRLQGVADLPDGGSGAVLHPLHADARSLSNPGGEYRPDTHLAFLGTGGHTIDIVDTFHFFLSGRIFIRDVISGPLRAVLPFPDDNAGLQCQTTDVTDQDDDFIGRAVQIFANGNFNTPHPATGGPTEDRCVVLKLFGVSDSGGVVVVDVRKSDILRNHPSRTGT